MKRQDMIEELRDLAEAARTAVANWETPQLAEAIRNLDAQLASSEAMVAEWFAPGDDNPFHPESPEGRAWEPAGAPIPACNASPAKSPGQVAYEADVAARPNYLNGSPRSTWEGIGEVARSSWERNPTPTARALAER